MRAEEIMTKEVLTVSPGLSVRELAEFLIKENISGAPVIGKENNFLGIVTEEDLIFQDKKIHLPTFLNLFSNIIPLGLAQMESEFKKIAGTQVQDVMQKEPRTIIPETTIEEIATMMTEEKIYYLPVLSDGRVAGVVTKRDLIKAVAKGKIW
ncbi:MAG: CBS domain-containing protein [Candidatus Omnitrophica bacterium]|nr:CBS domain-containing protein [Candidatus Omnitrophota bacterium]MBU4477528.1 CBS domain-containing protein [Candidatus Omnitrophota bacterium]